MRDGKRATGLALVAGLASIQVVVLVGIRPKPAAARTVELSIAETTSGRGLERGGRAATARTQSPSSPGIGSPKLTPVELPLPPGIATLCLDEGYTERDRADLNVTRVTGAVRHVDRCAPERVSFRQRQDCADCAPETKRCGVCGADGFYRLDPVGELVVKFRQEEAPAYQIQFQLRAAVIRRDSPELLVRVGNVELPLTVRRFGWHWSEPLVVEDAGRVDDILLRATSRIDLERLRIEKVTPYFRPR